MTANSPRSSSTGSQAAWVIFGDSLTFVALFVTSMVLARTISKTDMATFKQVTYLGPMVLSVVELGISSTVYRYFRYFQGARQKAFLWQTSCASAAMGCLGTIAILALAYPLGGAFRNPALTSALLIAGAYPLVMLPFMLVRPLLICKGYSLKATSLETLFALGTSLALILPLRSGASLNHALTWWIVAHGCRLPLTGWYMFRELRGTRLRWDSEVLREVWGYTWPLQLSRLPGLATVYLDKIVTSIFLTKEAFAAYSLGAREIPFLNRIAFSMSSVLVPKMVERFQAGDVGAICGIWRKACLSTAFVTFPFAAFCIWHAVPIVRVMFTSTYDASAIPFSVFAGLTFLRVVDYGSLAKALGNSRIILRGAALTALISLPLSLGLTYVWGVWGISFSLLLSALVLITYCLLRYRDVLQCAIIRFYPVPPLLMVMAAAFAAVAAVDFLLGRNLGLRAPLGTLELALRLSAVLTATLSLYAAALLVVRRLRPQFFVDLWVPGFGRWRGDPRTVPCIDKTAAEVPKAENSEIP